MRTVTAQPADVPIIHQNAVYTLDQARGTLQLAKDTLGREIRLGRLRVARRAGKYLILGSWLLEWIEAGDEITRRPRSPRDVDAVLSHPAESGSHDV
jgi:hypothetical protein